jgi:hypothetical protein
MTATALDFRLPPGIYGKLAALRRRVYFCLALGAAGRIVLVLAGMALLSLGADWFFRMDRASRAVILILAALTLLTLLLRWLIQPLRGRLSDDALALRVEKQNPELGQSLVSALQFARLKALDPQFSSPQLLHAAVAQGARAAAAADFSRALDPRFRRRAGAAALAAFIALAAFAAAFAADNAWNNSYLLGKWFRRNVLLTEERWNPRIQLSLWPEIDPRARVAQGDDYTQQVKVVRGRAGRLLLHVRFGLLDAAGNFTPDGRGAMTEDLSRVGPDEDRQYAAELRNLTRPFQVQADGGAEAVTAWRTVRVVPRPRLEALNLTCEKPAYTEPDPARRLDHFALDSGAYETIRGSRISFEGLCTKPLASAQVLCNGKPVGAVTLDPAPDNSADSAPGPVRFHGVIPPEALVTGMYAFNVTDADGFKPASPTELNITVQPDRKPEVHAVMAGFGALATTRAVIPLSCTFTDDFGVTDAALLYKSGTRTGIETAWGNVQTIRFTGDVLSPALPARAAQGVYRFSLGPLKLAPGTQL